MPAIAERLPAKYLVKAEAPLPSLRRVRNAAGCAARHNNTLSAFRYARRLMHLGIEIVAQDFLLNRCNQV